MFHALPPSPACSYKRTEFYLYFSNLCRSTPVREQGRKTNRKQSTAAQGPERVLSHHYEAGTHLARHLPPAVTASAAQLRQWSAQTGRALMPSWRPRFAASDSVAQHAHTPRLPVASRERHALSQGLSLLERGHLLLFHPHLYSLCCCHFSPFSCPDSRVGEEHTI